MCPTLNRSAPPVSREATPGPDGPDGPGEAGAQSPPAAGAKRSRSPDADLPTRTSDQDGPFQQGPGKLMRKRRKLPTTPSPPGSSFPGEGVAAAATHGGAPAPDGRGPSILLVTGGKGHTHRLHMQEVERMLRKMYPDFIVHLEDFRVGKIERDGDLQREYDETSRNPDRNAEKWKKWRADPANERHLEVMGQLIEGGYNLILGNYDKFVCVAADLREKRNDPDAGAIFQLASDPGRLHPDWIPPQFLSEQSKDRFLTIGKAIREGEADQKQFALDRGMPANRIVHVGAPVRQMFYEVAKLSQDECRARLRDEHQVHVPADKTSVLLMSGSGFWPQKLIETTKALANSSLRDQLHIKVVAGESEEARAALGGIADEVFDFVAGEKLPLLLKAVDFPCIKAGGGAIPDMIALGKGFIVSEALPGPEPENAVWVEEQGVGRVALTHEKLEEALQDLVDHPMKVEAMVAAQKPHVERDSAMEIARLAAQAAWENYRQDRLGNDPEP
jgi:hypothetical protein